MTQQGRDATFTPGPSEVVASFTSYEDAAAAVDHLADRRFPVDQVAIVAANLRLVEQVLGRRGYGHAASDGAVAGAVTGAFLGFFLGVLSLIAPLTSGLVLAFWGLLTGGVIGAIVGALGHALFGGRRDFRSTRGLDAGRYDLVASASVAEPARRLLAARPARVA